MIVHARNFVDQGQRYSLAITGCFSREAVQDPPTPAATPAPQATAEEKPSLASRSSCPSSRQFQLVLNTAENGDQLLWNLVGSTVGNDGVKTVASGPPRGGDGYEDQSRYVATACLEPSRRYRFQLRNRSGGAIAGRYELSYGGQAVFDTRSSSGVLGRVSTFRFKTTEDDGYQRLGSNAFAPHIQSSEEVVMSTSEAADLGLLSKAYDDYSDGGVLAQATSSVNWSSNHMTPTSEDVEEVGEAKEAFPEGGGSESNDANEPFIDSTTYDDHLEALGEAFEHAPANVDELVDRGNVDGVVEVGEPKTVDTDEFGIQQQEFEGYEDGSEPTATTEEDDKDHLEIVGEVFEHMPAGVGEPDREGVGMREDDHEVRDINTGEPIHSSETLLMEGGDEGREEVGGEASEHAPARDGESV